MCSSLLQLPLSVGQEGGAHVDVCSRCHVWREDLVQADCGHQDVILTLTDSALMAWGEVWWLRICSRISSMLCMCVHVCLCFRERERKAHPVVWLVTPRTQSSLAPSPDPFMMLPQEWLAQREDNNPDDCTIKVIARVVSDYFGGAYETIDALNPLWLASSAKEKKVRG